MEPLSRLARSTRSRSGRCRPPGCEPVADLHEGQLPIRREPPDHSRGDPEGLGGLIDAEESAEDGLDDAFLHLTLHLSISEQCAMDQPRGIRQAVDLLSYRRDSLHAAHHEVMGCLKQTLLASQKTGHIPDETTYLACVQRHSTRERSFFHMD